MSTVLTEVVRISAFTVCGLFAGFTVATIRRYLQAPPRSKLRRIHVVGVSVGTSILVIGYVGLLIDLERAEHPIRWYGAPTVLLGVGIITLALAALFRDQSRSQPPAQAPPTAGASSAAIHKENTPK